MAQLTDNEKKLFEPNFKFRTYGEFINDYNYEEINQATMAPGGMGGGGSTDIHYLYRTFVPPKQLDRDLAKYIARDFYFHFQRPADLNNPEDENYLFRATQIVVKDYNVISSLDVQDKRKFLSDFVSKAQKTSTTSEAAETITTGANFFPAVKGLKFLKYAVPFLDEFVVFGKVDGKLVKSVLTNNPELIHEFNDLSDDILAPSAFKELGRFTSRRQEHFEAKRKQDIAGTEELLKTLGMNQEQIKGLMQRHEDMLVQATAQIEDVWNQMKFQQKQAEIKGKFDAIANVGGLLVQIGQMYNDVDLQKAGATISAVSQASFAFCQLTGALGVEAVTGFAMLNPAVAFIGGALAIFSILSGSNDNDGMQKAFEQLFSALDTIRKDIHEGFNQMHQQFFQVHKEVFQIYDLLGESMIANEYNFLKVRQSLNEIGIFQKYSHFILKEGIESIFLKEISDLITDIQNGKSAFWTSKENMQTVDKFDTAIVTYAVNDMFNTGGSNPKNLLTDNFINEDLRSKPTDQNIGFLVNYAKVVLNITGLPNVSIANPALFSDVAYYLPNIAISTIATDRNYEDRVIKILNNSLTIGSNILLSLQMMKDQNVFAAIQTVYAQELNAFSSFFQDKLEENRKAYNLPLSIDHDISELAKAVADENRNAHHGEKNLGIHHVDVGKGFSGGRGLDFRCDGRGELSRCAAISSPHSHQDLEPDLYFLAQRFDIGSFYIAKCLEKRTQCEWRGFHEEHNEWQSIFHHHSKNIDIAVSDKTRDYTFKFDWNVDSEVKTELVQKFTKVRSDFLRELSNSPEYSSYIKHLSIYEKVLSHYAFLLDKQAPSGFVANFTTQVSQLQSIDAYSAFSIDPLASYNSSSLFGLNDSNFSYYNVTKAIIWALNGTMYSIDTAVELLNMNQSATYHHNNKEIFKQLYSFETYIANIENKIIFKLKDISKDSLDQFRKFFSEAKKIADGVLDKGNKFMASNEVLQTLFKDLWCVNDNLYENMDNYKGDNKWDAYVQQIDSLAGDVEYIGNPLYCAT